MFWASFAASAQQAAKKGATVNPHWDPNRCAECHQATGGKPTAIAPPDVDRTCLRCHDGRAAAAEAHPVGGATAKGRAVPAGWPTDRGGLGCATCHDVRKACATDAARTPDNARMLRGAPANPRAGTFCENCHSAAEYPRFNPHLMLTPEREVKAERCLTCHTEAMDRGAVARTGRPHLPVGEVTLCGSCHAAHKDQFNPGHLGSKVNAEMQALIRVREVIGLAVPPGPELLAQVKATGGRPTLMPLTPQDTITCTTCHNPHQAGVFRPGTPLAYRPMRVVGDRAVSPVRGDQWCNHCHDL